MRKKRRKFSSKKSFKKDNSHKRHKHPGSASQSALKEQLLLLLYTKSNNTTLTLNQIIKELKLNRSAKAPLEFILTELLDQKLIRSSGQRGYCLKKQLLLCEGTLEQTLRGLGFVSRPNCRNHTAAYLKDPIIKKGHMGSSRHGDKVLIHIYNVRRDGRPEAVVLAVLERKSSRLVGFVKISDHQTEIIPEDPRFPFHVLIEEQLPKEVKDGDGVIVKIADDSYHDSILRGRIIEHLGDPNLIDVQMRMVIEKFNLSSAFSEKALQEAESLQMDAEIESDRLDLREILHVTIDGETAKDFDDAVAVIKTRNGYRLYVSIADVSHFVRPGSTLDKEANGRGTSIYFPGRVIPMLPEQLSNNLCSLLPNKDRLTFTAILDFDRQGQRKKKTFCKSIIKSHQRFTYTTVRQIVIDQDPAIRRNHKKFLTPLKWAAELARGLAKKRRQRGSIGFTLPEPDIRLDEEGKIESISRTERNFAHQMIEEFMLAANEAVAETFTEQKWKSLYRVHERPDQEKVREFASFTKSIGLHLPPYRQDPDWFGQVLEMVADSPKEYVVNNLLLRTMQQARYDVDNAGHFGLAATDYTHFTSPIRRYPDLLVHRALFQLITKKTKRPQAEKLKNQGVFLSGKEREAISAERDMADRLKRRYMENKVGESFKAVISGVNEFAFFVELLDIFISGSVALSQMNDDYYHYNPKQHRLEGERTAKTYQLGDLVTVTLLDVDQKKNRINFKISNQGQNQSP